MNSKTQHVVPNPNGGWSVIKGGADKASRTFESKKAATGYARKISVNQKSELFIHGKDGRIQRIDSYGNDPTLPRDENSN